MDHIETAQDGEWSSSSTWQGGIIPSAMDEAIIKHNVIVSQNFSAIQVSIKEGGSITTKPDRYVGSTIKAVVERWALLRVINDTRTVRLDGVLFNGVRPSIGCEGSGDGLPYTSSLRQDANQDIIIVDPGYIGVSAKLQDITPEGCGRAYARKVSNAVRYLTVTVRIRATKPHYLGMLYRMAEGPFQVLLVTDRAIIKGHIETVVPDQASVGTEYISVRVTVAEGS